MSVLTTAVRSVLVSHAGTAALVGDRVYLVGMPEGAVMPALTVEQISGGPKQGIREELVWHESRVQVDAFAPTAAALASLVAQVKAALRRYRGVVGAVTFDDVLLDNEVDLYDPTVGLRRTSLDYIIHHAE